MVVLQKTLLLVVATLVGVLFCACPSTGDRGGSAHEGPLVDVCEAVYRYQMQNNESSAVSRGEVDYFFLSYGEGEDADADIIARFKGRSPKAVPLSESLGGVGALKVIHAKNRGVGVILQITSVRWVGDTEAVVEGGYYESRASSSKATYRVVRGGSGWVVASKAIDWIS